MSRPARVLASFGYAFKGLGAVWREEHIFQLDGVIFVLVMGAMAYWRFSFLEFAAAGFAFAAVFSAEILNTALEDLCNKLEPNEDAAIGKIKDMAAAAALVMGLGALAVIAAIFLHHFPHLKFLSSLL